MLGTYLYDIPVCTGKYWYVLGTYLVCTCIFTHFTRTWASLETTLSQLFSIVIGRWRFSIVIGSEAGKPRLCCLTIEETSDRQDSASKVSDKHWKETRDGSKGDGA